MTVAKYRKKPVVIEAWQLTTTNGEDVASWCGGKYERDAKPSDPTDVAVSVVIPTLEGNMRANIADYVIRGVQGEYYPCKPDIFTATYEPVHT